MAGILNSLIDKYNYVVYDLADPRTANWWGVSNPLVVLSITASYLFFCKSLGPRLMSNRRPFELKTPIMLYNIFQVLLSLFIVYEATVCVLSDDFNFACGTVDYSNSPRALRTAAGAWWFYFAKITELIDTVFFVLRKKFNQVSFLHVYHHTLMSLAIWFGVKYFPGGHPIVMGYLNAMVHVVMYSYYFISGLGPEYQKYVWWKKYVTVIQLIQFVIIFFHNAAVFFYPCSFPKALNVACLLNAAAFIYMFGKFYIHSYNKSHINKTALESKTAPVSKKINNGHSIKRTAAEKSR